MSPYPEEYKEPEYPAQAEATYPEEPEYPAEPSTSRSLLPTKRLSHSSTTLSQSTRLPAYNKDYCKIYYETEYEEKCVHYHRQGLLHDQHRALQGRGEADLPGIVIRPGPAVAFM